MTLIGKHARPCSAGHAKLVGGAAPALPDQLSEAADGLAQDSPGGTGVLGTRALGCGPVVELLAAAPHCPQAQFILQGKRNLVERTGNGDTFAKHSESIPGCEEAREGER